MLDNTAASNILSSNSILTTPVLFAEWNYNLFSPPYVTTAGNGTKLSFGTPVPTPSNSTTIIKENFTTKTLTVAGTGTKIEYPKSSGLGGKAYKIITYIKTDSASPVIVNTYATSSYAYGSFSDEVNSFVWKKFELIIGLDSPINDFIYTMNFTSKNGSDTGYKVYFTDPEIYETTSFDYYNGTLWPTKAPFTYFRPGESYVGTGNKDISFPDNYRRIATQLSNQESLSGGYYGNKYMPISRVMYTPKGIVLNNPAAYSGAATAYQNPLFKNGMISDTTPYKYFASDETDKKITAIYEENIYVNKIVLKFNNMIYTPTVSVTIGATTLTNQTPDSKGLLVLYWDGTTWSSTRKWSKESPVPVGSVAMPSFNSDGDILLKTAINKITVEQTGQTINPLYDSSYFTSDDFKRMNLIECSPRLEVDLSDFIENFSIQKSMDSGSTSLPVSFVDSNDASFTLSNIPAYTTVRGVVPIFSNESTNQYSALSKMLIKNIKMSAYLKLNTTAVNGSVTQYANNYIPMGSFYSDSWVYNEGTGVTVQAFDITRYLQSVSTLDYAGQLLSIDTIVSNLLDFVGFTDYDYDSLYDIANDENLNMDLAYYFANSKDKTVLDCLKELFIAYQISAYIDEYGVMKFKSLPKMLLDQTSDITLNDFHIVDNGFKIENKQKPGKVSMNYSPPKIKQSASLQNVEDLSVSLSPSFVLTTQNDIVWQQQSYDSLGFNYLQMPAGETVAMTKDATKFRLKVADLMDIFYTYSRDYDGYAFIEDEAVSFKHKEYEISQVSNPSNKITVSVKNDFELKAKINQFVKKYRVGLSDEIDLSGKKKVSDVLVAPTGYITNVRRGLFGTKVREHQIINSNLESKNLQQSIFSGSMIPAANVVIEDGKIKITEDNGDNVYIYSSIDRDEGYKTYSISFTPILSGDVATGIFFNCNSSETTLSNMYTVELDYSQTFDTFYISITYDGNTLYTCDVTSIAKEVYDNAPQVYKNNSEYTEGSTTVQKFQVLKDRVFTLKVVHLEDDPEVGNINMSNPGAEILRVYLNGTEIKQWNKVGSTSTEIPTNLLKLPRSAIIPTTVSTGTIFGALMRGSFETTFAETVYLREIYACTEPLIDEADSYFHKSQYFLNNAILGKSVPYKSYMMQTNPSASGLNYYDVQYESPAATTVDVVPVKYLLVYQPSDYPADVAYRQKLRVLENAAQYSCPINTGFRAKMMIANNSPMTVYLNRDADSSVLMMVRLNLTTNQVIASSDEEIIEFNLDESNVAETVQFNSEWVQSSDSAYSILNTISSAIDGFSVNLNISIFGNPLIQTGDIISLTYPIAGISNQKYIVKEVSHQYENGLSTDLSLSRI